MTEPGFSINDRRASARTASGLHIPGANWQATANQMRSRGYILPTSGTQARIQARKVVSEVRERGTVTDVQNRAMASAMRQERFQRVAARTGGGMAKTGANVQMVLPKVRQPLSSLLDKGIPYNVQDPKELTELRRWCSTPRSPVWMGDYSFKPIGEIEVGEQVIGWEDEVWQWDGHPTTRKRRQLVRSTVLAVNRRVAPEVVRIRFASGRIAECTPDHEWLRYHIPNSDGRILHGPEKSTTKHHDSDYAPLQVGSIARSVIVPTEPLTDPDKIAAAHYLAGMFDGDGTWRQRSIKIYQSEKKNPEIAKRIDWALDTLGMTYTRHVRSWSKDHRGGEMVVWELCRGDKTDRSGKNRQQLVDFYNWAHPAKFDFQHMDTAWLTKNFGEPDTVVSIESLGPGEVVALQTTTGNYTAWGYASKNCRLFYSTHDLVPLLIEIYSKFPVTGLEFSSKDPKIESFYEDMFMGSLNYEEFLPDGLMREYFMVGEVTALAHFNEQLGIWSSEEILNPDMVRVSKSLFIEEERVQLMVKELVETLRTGPMGMSPSEESPSEKYERNWEYCCTPDARVLTAAMNWEPVRSLKVGDKIVGFDEFAPGGRGNGRCLREATVTATSVIGAPIFKIVTDGPRVSCTGAHMWLTKRGSYGYSWIRTDEMRPGDLIKYFGEWTYEDDADTGYISGILDGEGWFNDGTLAFAQRPGAVFDKTVAILERHKFKLAITPTQGGRGDCLQVRILGGITEMGRCIGTFRPVRLTAKFYAYLDGKDMAGRSSYPSVVVQSITSAGISDVIALATSTKTLIVEGMFSHNTQIVKHYPEIIKAASQDDGLDISDALVSRMVNKAAWWDLRGTPHLLRSFRTLMLEESLNAAQDAVCDRLYAPMILATLGIEGAMGDGEPWIPDQGELEELRDDIQSALAADFKLLCHNFGLKIESVFGRESVPRFDTDYDRVDAKLMQAWGIGQALIMGGTGAGGTYASSAINREVCEQLMKSAQNKAIRHMRKRMEVIAEAQEHYDFDLKGGVRVPIYREIVQYNEETGEQEIVRVPKLLIPDIKFSTLNLRDEATERSFVSQLKQMGVPVSDKSLAINIPFEFKQELERQAQETKDKGMAQAEAMHVLQEQLDEKGYAYPPELAQFLQATLSVRAGLAQAEAAESQNKMLDQQVAQASPAGMMGLLPGTTMMPLAGSGSTAPPGQEPPEQPSEQDPGATADPTLGAGASSVAAPQTTASMHGPRMAPPGGAAPPPGADDDFFTPEIPRNRNRPEESDEMRAGAPKKARKADTGLPGRNGQPDPVIATSRFTKGPSSYGRSKTADERRVQAAIRRREVEARGGPTIAELVDDPEAFAVTNMGAYQSQLQADLPELLAGGGSQESQELLRELVEQYEEVTGIIIR